MPLGIGRFIGRNAGAIGTVAGGGIGLAFGNPILGATLGGALGGALQGTGAGHERPEIDIDPDGLALKEYERLKNPIHMLPVFQRLAAASAPTADQILSATAAQGGSAAIAREQAEAAQQRAGAMATGAFERYRLGADRLAQGALGMEIDNQRFEQGLAFEDYAQRRASSQAMGSEFLSGAAGLLAFLYGPQMMGQGSGGDSFSNPLGGVDVGAVTGQRFGAPQVGSPYLPRGRFNFG